MTYFPPNVFNNIKAYAGFDPTWRYKKIAKAVDAHVKWYMTAGNRNDYFHSEENVYSSALSTIHWVRDGCGDLFTQKKSSFRFAYDRPYGCGGYGNIIGLPSTVKKWGYSWVTKPGKPQTFQPRMDIVAPTRIKQHILLDNWIEQKSGPKNLTMKDLKQYCRDNKMKGYSKFKKTELIRFIMKYEFD